MLYIPDGIHVLVTVQPAGLAVGVAQSDLAAVNDDLGLTSHNGAEAALEAGLELRGHQAVVSPGLGQNGEVEPEEAEVEQGGDGGEERDPGGGVSEQLPVREVMTGQEAPEVLGQQKQAEEARVDPDILHTARSGMCFIPTLHWLVVH